MNMIIPQIFYDSNLESSYNAITAIDYLTKFYSCSSTQLPQKLKSLIGEIEYKKKSITNDNITLASYINLENKVYHYLFLANNYANADIDNIIISNNTNDSKINNIQKKLSLENKYTTKEYLNKLITYIDSTTADKLDIYTATLCKNTTSRAIKNILGYK